MNQPITFLQRMQQLFSSGATPNEIAQEVEAEAARVAADAETDRLARDADIAALAAAQITATKSTRIVTSEIIAAACIRNGMSQEECDAAIEAVFIRRGE